MKKPKKVDFLSFYCYYIVKGVIKLEIGERIAIRRKELNLTQEELANKLGYKHKSAINKIETGVNDLSQTKVKLFADALNTTPGFLMGWEEEKTTDIEISESLSEDEHLVLELFRKIPKENQRIVINMIRAALKE